MKFDRSRYALALPLLAAVLAVAALVFWWARRGRGRHLRAPARSRSTARRGRRGGGQSHPGRQTHPGHAQPANLPGLWPQFRGPNRDGISPETTPLARSWDAAGPRQLWAVDCGEGYAGVAVREGRVYLMDYDYDKKQNALRCLSLADGGEIWRFAYTLPVKRNHGMTRTVPALSGQFVVAMDPKCHVLCLDAATGELRWGMNLVSEFGATVPPWYAGQCPLIDGGAVILAPGGHDALLAAVDLETGKTLWRAPNPHGWKMTHSSVMPMEFGGRRFYVYCGSGGVAGVSAKDGALLWETDAWKISIATVPSPLVLEGGKIFLCRRLQRRQPAPPTSRSRAASSCRKRSGSSPPKFSARPSTRPFSTTAISLARGPTGNSSAWVWTAKSSGPARLGDSFGLGPFLLADGLFFVMNDSGKLSLVEDSSTRFNLLAQAQVLKGRESWAPMALAGGRLLARDFTRLVCLDVAAPSQPK